MKAREDIYKPNTRWLNLNFEKHGVPAVDMVGPTWGKGILPPAAAFRRYCVEREVSSADRKRVSGKSVVAERVRELY